MLWGGGGGGRGLFERTMGQGGGGDACGAFRPDGAIDMHPKV